MPLKSFLTKVGLVEEEIQVKPRPVQQAAPQPTQSFPVERQTPSYAPTPSYVPAPTIDPAISDMLAQSLQENKLSGFDYLKFTSAVEESKAMGVAEDARFKMTFSTAKQLGVDKPGLVKSGEHYLAVLTQDESDFNTDCANYDKKEIQSRAAKISQIESTITDLTKQLAQLQQDHGTLTQELQDETSRLESRKNAFQVTLQTFRANIQSNLDKINQYL
jgi:hypothetical protein